MSAAIPEQRLDHLEAPAEVSRQSELLPGTGAERTLARLAGLAAELAGAPLAMVVLADGARVVSPASGAAASPASVEPVVERAAALCRQVLASGEPLLLDAASTFPPPGPDAASDLPTFAGLPLHPAGQKQPLGVLCVFDAEPRCWTEQGLRHMQLLAGSLTAELELRLEAAERRRLQSALSQNTRLYREVVERASDIIYRTDRAGHFTLANPAAARVTGYAPEELVGMHFTEVVRPDYQERLQRLYARQVSEAINTTYLELPIRTRDGREVWIGQNLQLLREGERVVGVQAVARDVTEQRAVEQALRESEERFRNVVESLGEGLVITDHDDVIVYCNWRITALTGFEVEELVGRVAHEVLFPADEWERARQEMSNRLRGISGCYEVQHVRKDGESLWLEINAVPYRGPDGEIVGTLALVQDIGERRRAQQALRESEARFRAVFESAAYGIAVLDPEGHFLEVNHSVEQRFGFRGRGIRRLTLDQVTHPDDRERSSALRRALLAGDTDHYVTEQRIRDRSGRYRWVRLGVSVVRSVSAEPEYLIAVGSDVTRQRENEEALRESEERFRLMVEGSEQVFFYVHDAEHRFEYLSPSVQAVLGYSPEELVGKPYDVLLTGDPSDEEVHSQTDETLRTGGGFSSYTALTRHKDGRNVPIEVVETPVRRDGVVVGMQGFARDITERHRAKEALESSERYFRSLTENALDVIHVINADGTTRYLSPSVTRLLGYTPQELVGQNAREFIHPDDLPLLQEQIQAGRGAGPSGPLEFRVRHRDGGWRTFEGVMRNLLDDPVVAGVVINSRDITERRQTEEESRRLAVLSRENPNPVLQCNAQGEPVHVNPAAESISTELGLESVHGLLPENHLQLIRSSLANQQGFQHVEATVGGRIFSWTYRPHPDSGVVYLFAVDITGRRHMEEQLRHDALHDSLTGLPNRLLFLERLAHAILRTKRRENYLFAVLFLDLDRFKVINDSLGHHVGDELLMVIAKRLQACLRPEDTVARLGGDEFAILLEDIGAISDATRVAERIQAELAAPVNLSGFDVFTSASIGIALSSIAYERPEYLLRNADMAMYRAKAAGQARFEVFDRAMHAEALTRLQLETDLRRALEREEFRLHYQPIISLATGELWGLEALVRWKHPDRGELMPGQFVPIAEETGIIVPIGGWVLREACRQLCIWRERFPVGREISMGVNLSAKQLSQPDLVEQVAQALRDTGLPAHALRLEVTESAVMENAEAASVLLSQLKGLGVQISLDDFGTGYSSLSYLHRFPLDALKIDRSFVGRMTDEDRSTHLVHTILTLARSLGVAAVAEGVETDEQFEVLRSMGCELVQGYLFSQPLSPESVETMFERGPRW